MKSWSIIKRLLNQINKYFSLYLPLGWKWPSHVSQLLQWPLSITEAIEPPPFPIQPTVILNKRRIPPLPWVNPWPCKLSRLWDQISNFPFPRQEGVQPLPEGYGAARFENPFWPNDNSSPCPLLVARKLSFLQLGECGVLFSLRNKYIYIFIFFIRHGKIEPVDFKINFIFAKLALVFEIMQIVIIWIVFTVKWAE